MDFFVWATIILGIWAALGPLVGVYYGHVLSKRWQKEHWITENKKQEYREVLSTLTEAFSKIVLYGSPGVATGPEEQRARNGAESAALAALRDRLFIANELSEFKALDRWLEATRDFDNKHDVTQFSQRFRSLSSEIRQAGLRYIENV